jgi:hypothetical protein
MLTGETIRGSGFCYSLHIIYVYDVDLRTQDACISISIVTNNAITKEHLFLAHNNSVVTYSYNL